MTGEPVCFRLAHQCTCCSGAILTIDGDLAVYCQTTQQIIYAIVGHVLFGLDPSCNRTKPRSHTVVPPRGQSKPRPLNRDPPACR